MAERGRLYLWPRNRSFGDSKPTPANGLRQRSYVMAWLPTTVAADQLEGPLGRLGCSQLSAVLRSLAEALDLAFAYPADGRVVQLLRGGSWNNNPRNCRSAYRNHNQPDNHNNNVGFRVVCLPQHPSASEPLEGIPAGAQEGSRPAPVIGRLRPPIRTAPGGAPLALGPVPAAIGAAPLFPLS